MAKVIRSIRRLAPSLNDGDLALAARAGEAWAREALFERHVEALRALAFRLLGPYLGARELVESTFVAGFAALPQLSDPATFFSWMLRHLVLLARKRLRSSFTWSWRERGSSRPDFGAFAAQLALARSQDDAREAARFYEGMEALPSDWRVALILRELHGLDTQEIASAMQVPAPKVGKWLAQAAGRLCRFGSALPAPELLRRGRDELPIPLSEFERIQMQRSTETELFRQRRRRGSSALAWAAVAVFLLSLTVVGARTAHRLSLGSAHLQGFGNVAAQSLEFPDGSRASFPPDAVLRVDSADPNHVNLTLVSGRAEFDNASATERGLLIRAADTRIVPLGSRFTVSIEPTAGNSSESVIQVRALDGQVELSRDAMRLPLVLASGESWKRSASPVKDEVPAAR